MKIILCALLALTFPYVGNAAAPSTESVDRFVALSIPNDTFAAMRKSIEDSQTKALLRTLASADLGKDTDAISRKLLPRFVADIESEFSDANLRALYCRAVADTYTQEEVDGILAFYESPPGKAYLAKKTAFVTSLGNVLGERAVAFSAKLQQELQSTIDEVRTATPIATPSK
jgi:hypothetical protein